MLETDHTQGLKKGDSLYIKTIGVGKIVDVALNKNYNVCLSIEMNKDIRIPQDSRFSICNINIFTKGIEIIPGKSKVNFSSADTIFQKIEVRNIPLDSIVEDIANRFQRSLPENKQKD